MSVVGTAKERALLREKTSDKDGATYKRTYLVRTNKVTDDNNVVEQAFGIPKYGYMWVTESSYDVSATVVGYESKQVGPFLWEVVVEYSSKKSDGGGGNGKNPTEEAPTISWSCQQIRWAVPGQTTWKEHYINTDLTKLEIWDSTGIVNSAYEPYVPPAEIDRAIPTFTFTRNELLFNHRYLLYYVNAVNRQKWFNWPKRCVRIVDIKAQIKEKKVGKGTFVYWEVQYTFQFNVFTWDLFLLDHGTYYWEGGVSTGVKKNHEVKGVPSYVLLTANGDRSTYISRYKRFQVYHTVDFAKLNIPLLGS